MRYCIRETHRNQPGDWSEVSLHDCIVTEIRREGDTLVFVLPEINVNATSSVNDSGRHLKTGTAEIRLTEVTERPDDMVPPFEILDHKYMPEEGRFSLLTSTRDDDDRIYAFRCRTVEYGFDAYNGDSWYQEAEDHQVEDLAKKIRQGHGLAVAALQKLLPKRTEECVQILIHAMTHDLRYDHQCNANRAEYLMHLLDLFPASEKERITAVVLAKHPSILDGEYCDFTQYVSLLRLWRERGNTQAEEILQNAGKALGQALDSRTEEPIGPDNLQDKYWYLCPETAPVPPNSLPPENAKNTPPSDPSIPSILETARGAAAFHPARYQCFLRSLSPDQVQLLADTADAEPDSTVKARLYSLFSAIPYPNDPTEMCALFEKRTADLNSTYSDPDLAARHRFITARHLSHALGELRHPAVRELGIRLVREAMAGKEYLYGSPALFFRNYDESEEDHDLLCDFLDSMGPYDESFDRYHFVEMTLMQYLCREVPKEEKTYRYLHDIYIHTHCSNCRRMAVELIDSLGRWDAWYENAREACRYDCDPVIRQIWEKHQK